MPMNHELVSIQEVGHASDAYRETIALREQVLRLPLGLVFDPDQLSREGTSFHLACRQGNVLLACLVLTPATGRCIRLRQVAVSPENQGRGYGRLLVRHAEDFAWRHGYREITMHARESAVGFYEKLGYAKFGDRFFEVTIPHYQMHRVLTAPRGGSQTASSDTTS